MATALVRGKHSEIRNLDDLLNAVETSIGGQVALVLIGDREERIEVSPSPQIPDEELLKRKRAAFEAAFGSWQGLVNTEQLKRDIYESRGQPPRDWTISETNSDE